MVRVIPRYIVFRVSIHLRRCVIWFSMYPPNQPLIHSFAYIHREKFLIPFLLDNIRFTNVNLVFYDQRQAPINYGKTRPRIIKQAKSGI